MLAYRITRDAINLVVDGETISIPRDALHADAVLAALAAGEGADKIKDLMDPAKAMVKYSKGDARFLLDGTVEYKGERLPRILAEKATECLKDGVPYQHLLNFFDRLKANPSQRAIEELYAFLEHKDMPITPEGHFLAYKGVRENYWSQQGNKTTKVIEGKTNETGHIYNGIGETIRVRRNHVNDDARVGCGSGLHAGSVAYATNWSQITVIVDIDPADVVSIPFDCECQKLRTAAYKVVGDFKGAIKAGGVDKNNEPYAGSPVTHDFDTSVDVAVEAGLEDYEMTVDDLL